VEGEEVTVRPIAGTRPRGATPEEDAALGESLRADAKELAEHRMLVDLGRNDIGRVAQYGSVRVTGSLEIERYSHVQHLVSEVRGTLSPGHDALDVFRACFPAGTVSGAPKVRAMEIIDEFEPERRGPYAGAVGYVGWGATSLDTCIAIRAAPVLKDRVIVQAGAGIVADSDPAREFAETEAKAQAVIRALSQSWRQPFRPIFSVQFKLLSTSGNQSIDLQPAASWWSAEPSPATLRSTIPPFPAVTPKSCSPKPACGSPISDRRTGRFSMGPR
jgi:anthranilate/para-aminobenzoate synthase component I